MAPRKRRSDQDNMFGIADKYEARHPGVAEAMRLYGVSIEQYQRALSALYTPRTATSNSTEDLHAHME